MWSATDGAMPVWRCTSAASSSFSSVVRGTPGLGKIAKRVPELPNAHEGVSTRRARERRALDPAAATVGHTRRRVIALPGERAARDPEEALVERVPSPGVRIGLVGANLGGAADELAHLGQRGDLAEGVQLHEDVAERGRLDRAGQHGPPCHVGGQLAEEAVLGAAADHVDDLDRRARSPPRSPRARAGTCRRGSRRRHGAGPRSSAGAACPHRAQSLADAGRHVAGGEQLGLVGVEERAAGGRAPRELDHVGVARGRAAAPASVRRHSWTSQRPITFFSRRMRAAEPALVGQVGRAGLLGDDRRLELDADERPGAARDVGSPSRRPERHGDHRRGGVVRGDRDDRRRRRQPGRLGDVRAAARRCTVPGSITSGKSARGRCRAARAAPAPSVPVRTSRSWVVLALVASAWRSPAQPVAEQVGDQEQRLGGGQRPASARARAAGRAC